MAKILQRRDRIHKSAAPVGILTERGGVGRGGPDKWEHIVSKGRCPAVGQTEVCRRPGARKN